MKTAIYIENGVTQLVITPENDWEKSVLKSVDEDANDVRLMRGSFYRCQGGWDRHATTDESLMIRVTTKSRDNRGVQLDPPIPGA